jgi:hypothetical protein
VKGFATLFVEFEFLRLAAGLPEQPLETKHPKNLEILLRFTLESR